MMRSYDSMYDQDSLDDELDGDPYTQLDRSERWDNYDDVHNNPQQLTQQQPDPAPQPQPYTQPVASQPMAPPPPPPPPPPPTTAALPAWSPDATTIQTPWTAPLSINPLAPAQSSSLTGTNLGAPPELGGALPPGYNEPGSYEALAGGSQQQPTAGHEPGGYESVGGAPWGDDPRMQQYMDTYGGAPNEMSPFEYWNYLQQMDAQNAQNAQPQTRPQQPGTPPPVPAGAQGQWDPSAQRWGEAASTMEQQAVTQYHPDLPVGMPLMGTEILDYLVKQHNGDVDAAFADLQRIWSSTGVQANHLDRQMMESRAGGNMVTGASLAGPEPLWTTYNPVTGEREHKAGNLSDYGYGSLDDVPLPERSMIDHNIEAQKNAQPQPGLGYPGEPTSGYTPPGADPGTMPGDPREGGAAQGGDPATTDPAQMPGAQPTWEATFQKGQEALQASLDRLAESNTRRLEELMARRGLLGSSIEADSMRQMLADLNAHGQQASFQMMRDMMNAELQGRDLSLRERTAADDVRIRERALALQEKGLDSDQAFRQAEFEWRKEAFEKEMQRFYDALMLQYGLNPDGSARNPGGTQPSPTTPGEGRPQAPPGTPSQGGSQDREDDPYRFDPDREVDWY
jgi:hypothetical protein